MVHQLRYLEIRMFEGERKGWFGAPWYQQFVKDLWEAGIPGVTVTRAESGLDRRGNVQNIHSEYVSDNLPILIECVAAHDEVVVITHRIQALVPKRLEAWTTTAYDAKLLERTVDIMSDYAILKVYMKESDQVKGEPLALLLMNRLSEMGINWVNVTTALEGYGKDQVLRRNHNFSLTNQAPIVLEAVLSKELQHQGVFTAIKPFLEKASGPAILIEGQSL